MAALTHEDLDHVRAQWEEWTSGLGFDLDVVIIGEHRPAAMDPDRPLGAVVSATRTLQIKVWRGKRLVFDQPCPCDGEALRASIAVLSRTIANWCETGDG